MNKNKNSAIGKIWKKVWVLVLIVCMMLGTMPLTAIAEDVPAIEQGKRESDVLQEEPIVEEREDISENTQENTEEDQKISLEETKDVEKKVDRNEQEGDKSALVIENDSVKEQLQTSDALEGEITPFGIIRYDIGNGNVLCNQPGTEYQIFGQSDRNFITIKGGTEANPIIVNLGDLKMDHSKRDSSPITVENGYAVIYIGKTDANVKVQLWGGKKDRSLERDGARAALCVKENAFLTIAGEGYLYAKGSDNNGDGGAGIGSNDYENGFHLTIDGNMTIEAKGGKGGAGIGTGFEGQFDGLNIKSGTIIATGGEGGAGIGSGKHDGDGSGGDGQNIRISGGNITATGGKKAAAIGGSENGKITGIDISGGTIVATGGEKGAGIGGGDDGTVKDINISGGDITAKGGESSAGIGGGNNGKTDDILITDGVINTEGGHGASGVGSGRDGELHGIKIQGGRVTAQGGKYAPGIGPGDNVVGGALSGGNGSNIKISGGYVEAYGGYHAAGIGASEGGTITVLEISGGTVIAEGGENAAGIGSEAQMCSFLTISGGDVTATGGKYGAGIGGGRDAAVSGLKITGGTIVAKGGKNAAGIGAGDHVDAGDGGNIVGLTITGGNITTTGGENGAGIGGGDRGKVTDLKILQADNSALTIDSKGGDNGAGIGSAKETLEDMQIVLKGGTIKATGGIGAAGIGGGNNGYGGRGADLPKLSITGQSKVTATGGEGGAGIGGGMDGSAENLTFNLKTQGQTYFVKAKGGLGAAGIGSGSVLENKHSKAMGHEAGNIVIEGGYIEATGGADRKEGQFYLGSGAGIGGGSRWGHLNGFVVNGGIVSATAGGNDAFDIGRGGKGGVNPIEAFYKDKDFRVTGGTIFSKRWSDDADISITGGSVTAKLDNIMNGDSKKVYQTTLTLENEAITKVDLRDLSYSNYGIRDIYSDVNKRLYLYLPTSGKDEAKVDVCISYSDKRHYYGTTTTDGNGVLKIERRILFQEPISVVGGEAFDIYLMDAGYSGEAFEFAASGAVHLVSSQPNSPGAKATLFADEFGSYNVVATSTAAQSDPVYWGAVAEYTGAVQVMKGSIEITEDPSKTYDGAPIESPTVKKNGEGGVTYTYYAGANAVGTPLSSAPKNAGTYTVVAEMTATAHYTAAVSEPYTFTIAQREITLGMSAQQNGAGSKVIVTVMGLVEAEGKIRFQSGSIDESKSIVETAGTYSAELIFASVPAADYTINAEYVPGTSGNYICVNSPIEETYKKDKAFREIDVDPISPKTYGSGDFYIGVGTTNSRPFDRYHFEIAYDEFPNLEDALEVVNANSGKMAVRNAGIAVVKITLTDGTNTYNDAVKYVPISVSRAPLTVTSYAKDSGGAVTQAQYASLHTLEYELSYNGFVHGDNETTFTNGHGTLEATSLPLAIEVNSSQYAIRIAKVGADFEIGGQTYTDVFVSRNYELTLVEGGLEVIPAELTVQADDITSQWRKEPNYTYTLSGLAAWDVEEDTFTLKPDAKLDTIATGGLNYDDLEPNVYLQTVKVEQGTVKQNVHGKYNYAVQYTAGDLTVDKAEAELEVDVTSKVYDGSPTDVITQTAAGYDGGAPQIRYYRVDTFSSHSRAFAITGGQPLSGAPVDAGDYYVEVTAEETQHYAAETTQQYFFILKANSNPEIPKLPDMQMKDGLTLAQQRLPDGWAWINPDQVLQEGAIRAMAQYIPQDTTNYRNSYSYLEFHVTAAGIDPNPTPTPSPTPSPIPGGEDEQGGDGGADSNSTKTKSPNTPRTGDAADISGYIILVAVAIGGLVAVLLYKKRIQHRRKS